MLIRANWSAKVACAAEFKRPTACAIMARTVGLTLWLSRRRALRRGEKVPPTLGTVAHRFVKREDVPGVDGPRSILVINRMSGATLGTGVLGGDGVVTLLDPCGECAFGQARGQHRRHTLHVREVQLLSIDPRSGSVGRDFPPTQCQLPQFVQKLRRQIDR
ncbi:hypothetical protein FTUN_4002 [Frigoriglobus tundricola]|uniref:Uncharacterized protein n=1 Tax=Frigoriglobus tundricola TaxID=2774151 RepID=A0A6M5YQY7_9BACT|nr:hypothetical protein FTUN_4002 [Frigoriglobus tundricola]